MTSVTGELSLMLPDGTSFTETDLAASDPVQFPEFAGIDGRVTLFHGDETFEFGDTLLYLVTELCTIIAPRLKTDGRAVYEAIAHEEVITLTRASNVIEIASEYRKGISLPADDTLVALIGVGRRMGALLPRLWSEASPEQIDSFNASVEAAAGEIGLT